MVKNVPAWFAFVTICGWCAVATAQNIPGNPSRPGNPITTEQFKVSDEVKITGCVSKNASGVLQIKNPAIETQPWFNEAGAKTVAKPLAVKSATTFLLGTSNELQGHLNHRLQVTGVLEPGSANTPPTPDTIGGPGGTTGLSSGAVPRLDFPKVNIKALKMLSATCS